MQWLKLQKKKMHLSFKDYFSGRKCTFLPERTSPCLPNGKYSRIEEYIPVSF